MTLSSVRPILAASAFALALVPMQMLASQVSQTSNLIPEETFTFYGTCADCAGVGTGILTLENYTLGTQLATANFVSFSYTSNLISFNETSAANLSVFTGELPTSLPADALVIIKDVSNQSIFFDSLPNGSWCAGASCGADNGTASAWLTGGVAISATPEPASFLPAALAILGFGLARRRASKARLA